MGDYSNFAIADGDHVEVNGGATFPLPERVNNSVPENPDLLAWGLPYTVRLKLGDLVFDGSLRTQLAQLRASLMKEE